jgi:Protein of unknown function with PCYCGC motif
MKGKRLAMATALGLILLGTGLAQLHPAFSFDANAEPLPQDMSAMDQGVPSYHAYALKPPYPATLASGQFPDLLNRNVYAMAARIEPVLYQQPCYCYCDRHEGHKSLLDCFAGMHGSECDVCQKEAVFAYLQTKKAKTPAQIRAEIIHGDWKSVNLDPYLKGIVVH